MSTLKIKQIRSTIRQPGDQKATMRALGLGKMHRVVEHNDSPQIRGMITKVRHLVEVEKAGK